MILPLLMKTLQGINSINYNEYKNNNKIMKIIIREQGREQQSQPTQTKYHQLIKNYSNFMISIIIFLPLPPFLFILVRAILRPGLYYCSKNYLSCSSVELELGLSDIGTIIFGMTKKINSNK